MQIWRDITQLETGKLPKAVVMIGNFDGLHLGHQALLKRAAEYSGPHVVITFDPHPLQVLRPEQGLKRLFPREDLAEQLPRYGVDVLTVLTFTREFAGQTAEEFLNRYVGAPFRPAHVVAGYDFGFGKSREGSLASLRSWCEMNGAGLHVVPEMKLGDKIVSSRAIRELITRGEVDEAARWLGRPFYLRGEVVSGAGRGAQIGVPTLNQKVVNETLPALGVYATRTRRLGQTHPSVTNIGVNPTFGGSRVKVETHVLSGPCEARGESVDVEFVRRLRPEMKFSSIEDLKKQIQSDILKAKELLGVK